MLMAIACESLEPLGEVECEDEEENNQSMPVTLCVWTLLLLMKYHSARVPSRGLHPSLLQQLRPRGCRVRNSETHGAAVGRTVRFVT